MQFHIGKLIDDQRKKVGMTKSEFARRIFSTPQNIHYVLKRKSIDTDLLQKVSRTLDYDFFQHYLGIQAASKSHFDLIGLSSREIKIELDNIKIEIETVKRQNDYLREIVELIKPAVVILKSNANQKLVKEKNSHPNNHKKILKRKMS